MRTADWSEVANVGDRTARTALVDDAWRGNYLYACPNGALDPEVRRVVADYFSLGRATNENVQPVGDETGDGLDWTTERFTGLLDHLAAGHRGAAMSDVLAPR